MALPENIPEFFTRREVSGTYGFILQCTGKPLQQGMPFFGNYRLFFIRILLPGPLFRRIRAFELSLSDMIRQNSGDVVITIDITGITITNRWE